MFLINMTGEKVIVFTAGRKGQRDTADVSIEHGEDKRIHGHVPHNHSMLSLHKGPDDFLNNKIQVLPGKVTTWGNEVRRIVIRFQGTERPLPGSY